MLKIVAVWREKFVRFCRLLNWDLETGRSKMETRKIETRLEPAERQARWGGLILAFLFSSFEFPASEKQSQNKATDLTRLLPKR